MESTAQDLGSAGFDAERGAGRLDAASALEALLDGSALTAPPAYSTQVSLREDLVLNISLTELGLWQRGVANVDVRDSLGRAAPNVWVYGHFVGASGSSRAIKTSSTGRATFTSSNYRTSYRLLNDLRFIVDRVERTGASYASDTDTSVALLAEREPVADADRGVVLATGFSWLPVAAFTGRDGLVDVVWRAGLDGLPGRSGLVDLTGRTGLDGLTRRPGLALVSGGELLARIAGRPGVDGLAGGPGRRNQAWGLGELDGIRSHPSDVGGFEDGFRSLIPPKWLTFRSRRSRPFASLAPELPGPHVPPRPSGSRLKIPLASGLLIRQTSAR
jgi:hypothetical protein